MKPEHVLTGQQARRRAAWYRARVFARLFLARVAAPAAIVTPVGVFLTWAIAGGDLLDADRAYAVFAAAISSISSARWWHAERAAAIARQLYLDTRQGPLGKERTS